MKSVFKSSLFGVAFLAFSTNRAFTAALPQPSTGSGSLASEQPPSNSTGDFTTLSSNHHQLAKRGIGYFTAFNGDGCNGSQTGTTEYDTNGNAPCAENGGMHSYKVDGNCKTTIVYAYARPNCQGGFDALYAHDVQCVHVNTSRDWQSSQLHCYDSN